MEAKAQTAFILCAGTGSRLRPLTHWMPKVLVPFLNLPLICYNWFLLEQMGVSCFLLNSHLFPKKLEKFIFSIKKPEQKVHVYYEPRSLGSAGALWNLKSQFKHEKAFLYLNGDSLLFPSQEKFLKNFLINGNQLKAADGLGNITGLFYTVPFQEENWKGRALWRDEGNILRAIADKSEGEKLRSKWGRLRPSRFSGLALLNRDIFTLLTSNSFHIFDDGLNSQLSKGRFRVFMDEKGLVLEGGEFISYLNGTGSVLNALFSNENTFLKKYLEDLFFRFDPKDHFIGLKKGRELRARFKMPLLCPDSVKGLEFFSGESFAVLGPNVCFSGKSFLKNAVLGSAINWRGVLENKLLLSPDNYTHRV